MRASTAQEIYASTIQGLPPSEQLMLAALILEALTKANTILIEQRDEWSEEDVNDLVAYSTSHANDAYQEEDDIVHRLHKVSTYVVFPKEG